MAENMKVAISSDFLTAFARLPRQTQGKVTEFVNKCLLNKASPKITNNFGYPRREVTLLRIR